MDVAKTFEQLTRQFKQKDQLLKNAKNDMLLKDADCAQKVRKAQKEAKEAKDNASTQLALMDEECSKKVRKAQKEAKEANDNASTQLALMEADCSKKVRKAQKEAKEANDNASTLLSLKDDECSKKVRKAQKEAEEAKGAAKELLVKAEELQRIQAYLDSEGATQSLRTGSRVIVVGLSSSNGKALNGAEGVILSELDLGSGRFRVEVAGVGEKSLKIENLVLGRGVSGATFMKVREKFGAAIDGMRIKLRQQASELDHYRKQRHLDLKAKDDEIAALKKRCASLESSVRQLKAQPPPRMGDDSIIEECVKLMLKETPTDQSSVRKLMFCLHPDKNPATSIATKMMQYLSRVMG